MILGSVRVRDSVCRVDCSSGKLSQQVSNAKTTNTFFLYTQPSVHFQTVPKHFVKLLEWSLVISLISLARYHSIVI